MTTHTSPHQKVIAAALEDWWITTDPLEPFDPTTVADRVELYLVTAGYCIAPDTRSPRMPAIPPPSRTHIAVLLLLTIVFLALTGISLLTEHWGWAIPLTLATALTAWATTDADTERRRGTQ